MAAYISVPRDLTKVKSKVAFNLTKRQLVCFGTAALIGVPLFFVLRESGGNTAATLGMMAVMLPAFFLGMYEKNGQSLEKLLSYYVQSRFVRPKVAPKAKTGVEDVRNMRYVHCACQRIYAENRLKK